MLNIIEGAQGFTATWLAGHSINSRWFFSKSSKVYRHLKGSWRLLLTQRVQGVQSYHVIKIHNSQWKSARLSYVVSFFSALGMVSSESWKRIDSNTANFYPMKTTGTRNYGVPAGKTCTIYGKGLYRLQGNPMMIIAPIIVASIIIIGFPCNLYSHFQ